MPRWLRLSPDRACLASHFLLRFAFGMIKGQSTKKCRVKRENQDEEGSSIQTQLEKSGGSKFEFQNRRKEGIIR